MPDSPIPSGLRDNYATRVTHLRIFTDAFENTEWMLDGADDKGNYTESCWTFDSFEAAVEAMPAFVGNQPSNGVTFEWRNQRTDKK